MTSRGHECAQPGKPVTSHMTLAEFCAEAERIGLTFDVFVAQLAARPEFADCLPTRAEHEHHCQATPAVGQLSACKPQM